MSSVLQTTELVVVNKTLRRILSELSHGDGWQGNGAQAAVKRGAPTVAVASSAAGLPVELLRADPWRLGFLIVNPITATAPLTIYYGLAPSSLEYVVQIAAGASWREVHYTGPVYGNWLGGAGVAQVTTTTAAEP